MTGTEDVGTLINEGDIAAVKSPSKKQDQECTEKQDHGRGAEEHTGRQGHGRGAEEHTEKQDHEGDGIWASVAEYSRATHISKSTLKRWIKAEEFPEPVRKSLRVRGQKGSGTEIYTNDKKIAAMVRVIRRIKTAGLDIFEAKRVERTCFSQIDFKVESGIYLAGCEINNKIIFSDYLAILVAQDKSLFRRHRKIRMRVTKQNHAAVSTQAKAAGIKIMDAYKILYEQYVTSLCDFTNPKEETKI